MKIRIFLMVWLIAYSGSLYGQARSAPTANASSEIAALKKQLSDLEAEVGILRTLVLTDKYAVATLTPDDNGYARVNGDTGAFLVLIRDVTPYLDGLKVRLGIGGLNTAAYRNLALRLVWGPRNMTIAKQQSKIETVPCVAPNKWTTVEVILPATKPEDFGKLVVGVETNETSFAGC